MSNSSILLEKLIRVALDIAPLLMIIAGIICFVFTVTKKSYGFLILSAALNFVAGITGCLGCRYFDNLPGGGFMPGFTYLGDYLLQYGYAIIAFVLFVVLMIVGLIVMKIHNRNKMKRLEMIKELRHEDYSVNIDDSYRPQ